MGNKVSEEFIREFFEENKEKFKSLQDSFIGTLWGYNNLPVEDKEIELELHTDKIMLSLGDTRLVYQENIYGWNFKEENDGNAVRAD